MTKDFYIRNTSIEIVHSDNIYDVHNCYEFVELKLSFLDGVMLELLFDKIEGDWIRASDPDRIKFIFQSVKYFELSKSFVAEHFSTVEEFGYKDVNDFDCNWLLSEDHFNGTQHFVFSFEGNEYIRAFAEKIEIKTEFTKKPRTLYQ